MHAFFDGYVNVKKTLKQFVERYENTLKDKVQKETQEDFNCFNSWLPCITHYDMEKQFAYAYTTAKFKEFQMELTGKIYCSLFPIKEDGSISEYKVLEDVKIGDNQQHDFEKFKSMGIGYIEGPTASNVADKIGTQDSIVVNPSLQGHRNTNMPNYTPQIMLGVDVATNLNLMQGNLNLHGYSTTPRRN
ncbi:hypothetical protein F0562_013429 [Nyssa sinensis]|uniref:Protein FAR1-RELATED SEQUENCE n=1 Tax=Nyssa sinensis TaxID=561372 RepID=A0A5J4ZK69_9ASTE|nr:hypothetical protein F0562_013429 [Nyssa sinensis]